MAWSLQCVACDKLRAEPVQAVAVRGLGRIHRHALIRRGSAVKRKLASVLVSLVFGWLTTAAIAEDDTTTTTADSSTATSEPAAVTEEATTDTVATETSTSDGTIAATPTETDSK
jgi:hypothetical protein